MVAIFVVVAILVVLAILPRLVAVIEDWCWEGRIIRSRQRNPRIISIVEETVQFADLPADVRMEWERFWGKTAELPTLVVIPLVEPRLTCKACGQWGAEEDPAKDLCPWCMQCAADERDEQGWDCGVGGHRFFGHSDEHCSECGDHVGVMEAVETERCFECYAPVKERGDGLCDECWEGRKASDQEMWNDYYRNGGTDECQMVSDFAPSVKTLGGGRIEVNGLFVLTPADGIFYWEALNLVCLGDDDDVVHPHTTGGVCQQPWTLQGCWQAAASACQRLAGLFVQAARGLANALGFNPKWDATPVSRCGHLRPAACGDTTPLRLKAEWKKGVSVRLAALHRETMLGANLFAPSCVMSAEETMEDLPSFVAMSKGPKGRAKSRRDGDPGVAVVMVNRLGKQLQYREGVVVCKATHANTRERQIAVSRSQARKDKAFIASL